MTGAGGIIQDPNGYILLIHKKTSRKVQWEIPGGKVELNETPAEAVYREIKEETGLDVSVGQALGETSFSAEGETVRYLWFKVDEFSGKPNPLEEEYDQVGWFTLEQIAELNNLSPGTRNLLNAIDNGEVSI